MGQIRIYDTGGKEQSFDPALFKATQSAMIGSATVTVAQLLGRVIDGTPTGAANYQMPVAATLIDAMPGVAVGDSFMFFINNKAATSQTITVTAGGATLDGTITVNQNVIRAFLVIITNITTAAYYVYGLT